MTTTTDATTADAATIADLTTVPAARKLVADAQAAGLRVQFNRDDTFVRVYVVSADLDTLLTAEWWDGSLVREFNYASVLDLPTRRSRRATSLKAGRTAVGLS